MLRHTERDIYFGLIGIAVGFVLFHLVHGIFSGLTESQRNLIGVCVIVGVGGPMVVLRFTRARRAEESLALE